MKNVTDIDEKGRSHESTFVSTLYVVEAKHRSKNKDLSEWQFVASFKDRHDAYDFYGRYHQHTTARIITPYEKQHTTNNMSDKNHNTDTEDNFHIRDLLGFLWDFRERKVNQRSFWYGYATALLVYNLTVSALKMEIPSLSLIFTLLLIAVVGKWLQATHPLKHDN